MAKRVRRIGSIKVELLKKSREAAFAAIQIFNNPNISFKSESYTVLMIIAWTYMMHAYYRKEGISYWYLDEKNSRNKYEKTDYGARKSWELRQCLNYNSSPIDKNSKNNLIFLIGLRNEIEHQMTTRIDEVLNDRFQACCLNYNKYIKQLFGGKYGIEGNLSLSLQLSTITRVKKELLEQYKGLPDNIRGYIKDFDESLSNEERLSNRFSHRLIFVRESVNHENQADEIIKFISGDSQDDTTRTLVMKKETEKTKYLPGQVIELMKVEGYLKFSMYNHTQLWKKLDAKNRKHNYGTLVAEKSWHWYEKWVKVVRKHCKDNHRKYK